MTDDERNKADLKVRPVDEKPGLYEIIGFKEEGDRARTIRELIIEALTEDAELYKELARR